MAGRPQKTKCYLQVRLPPTPHDLGGARSEASALLSGLRHDLDLALRLDG